MMSDKFMRSFALLLVLFSFLLPVNAAQQTEPAQTVPAIWCHDFTSTMKIGDYGPDAAALNIALAGGAPPAMDSSHQVSYNSNYDEYTASRVSGFQEKYRSELLDPYGLEHGTGYVSKATVNKLNELYGCTQNSDLPPVIYSTGGPSELGTGDTGTWSVSAKDPEGGPLTYSVYWGDADSTNPGTASEKPAASSSQTATFTHSYANPGTYTITFSVTDKAGLSAKSTITVAVWGAISTKTGSATITVSDAGATCPMMPCIIDSAGTACPPCDISVQDATVTLYGENGAYYGSKRTSSGEAAFYGLPYGAYKAVATAPGYTSASTSFKITGGSMVHESIFIGRQWAVNEEAPQETTGFAQAVQSFFGAKLASLFGAVSG